MMYGQISIKEYIDPFTNKNKQSGYQKRKASVEIQKCPEAP